MKKIVCFMKRTIALTICTLCIYGCFGFFSNLTVNAEARLEDIGYFDLSKEVNAFPLSAEISGTVTGAEIVETATAIPTESISVSDKRVEINNIDAFSYLVQGAPLTLKISTTAGAYEYSLTFVAKAITTAEDCKVFDIATPTTIVEGYYVLLNDINLGDTVLNVHQGIFDSPNAGFTKANGFAGTLNGLGHNITFVANNNGFFGRLIRNATVINTGFVDVRFDFDERYVQGDLVVDICPILTRFCYFGSNEEGLVENCYFHTDEKIQSGAISYAGFTTDQLVTRNILIDYGTLNTFSDLNGHGLGCFIGNHTYVWSSPTRESVIKDVYVVSGYPLGVYAKTDVIDADTKQLVTERLNAGQTVNNYIRTYASNWGATEDLYSGVRVFQNIKQYVDYAAMSADSANDFSSFDGELWSTENGVLTWKNLKIKKEFVVSTAASVSKDNVNLDMSSAGVSAGKHTVKFYLAENYVKLENAQITATMLESYGNYTYITDNVTVVGSGGNEVVFTAVKKGISRILLTCTYDGVDYEYTIKLTVRNDEPAGGGTNEGAGGTTGGEGSGGATGGESPSEPPNTGENTPTGGCGSSIFGQGLPLLLVPLSCLGVYAINKKSKN